MNSSISLSGSIDVSISKGSIYESMSQLVAEDALNRKLLSLSNEQISKGEELLNTYKVTSDPILGGMGSVWQVYHQGWNLSLAMKRPQPRFFEQAGEERKAAFIDECENWITLGMHPNIVTCYYVREIGGVPTIFSEWMDAGSLKDVITDGSLYSDPNETNHRILDIAIQIISGLSYSHGINIVHQDIKPGNVLLNSSGEAKIADFGLAQAVNLLGKSSGGYTLQYCPLEQTQGCQPKPWMDIYAFAVTLLEMYAGKRLWENGQEVLTNLESIASRCLVPIPESILEFIQKCLTRQYDNCEAVYNRLHNLHRMLCGYNDARPTPENAFFSANALNNRGLSYLDLGKPEMAASLWEEGLEADPDNVDLVLNANLMRWRNGLLTDLETLSALQGHDYYLHSKEGQAKVNEVARESGKVSPDEALFLSEEHPFKYAVKDPLLCKLYGGKLYCPSLSKEPEDGWWSPPDLIVVYNPETGDVLEKHELSLPNDENIKRVFLSPDCRYAVLVSEEYIMHFLDLKTGKFTRSHPIENPGLIYNSYSRTDLIGKNCRFFNGLISYGLGHGTPPKPVILDLETGENVDSIWDWEKIAVDAGIEPKRQPGEYNEISDGLLAIPLLRTEKGYMRCEPDGTPIAPLIKKIKPFIKYLIYDYVLRVCEDGTFWRRTRNLITQWNAVTGRCLRTYNLGHLNCQIDSDGNACVGFEHEATGWKFRRFAPLDSKAAFSLSRIESYGDYLKNRAVVADIYEKFSKAYRMLDIKTMCELYKSGVTIPLFFSCPEQKEMYSKLSNSKNLRSDATYIFMQYSGSLPEKSDPQLEEILKPFYLEKFEVPRTIEAQYTALGLKYYGRRNLFGYDHFLLAGTEKNTGNVLLFDLDVDEDQLNFLGKSPVAGRFWEAGYSRYCNHVIVSDFIGGDGRVFISGKSGCDMMFLIEKDKKYYDFCPCLDIALVWKDGCFTFHSQESFHDFMSQKGNIKHILDASDNCGLLAYTLDTDDGSYFCVWSSYERRNLIMSPVQGEYAVKAAFSATGDRVFRRGDGYVIREDPRTAIQLLVLPDGFGRGCDYYVYQFSYDFHPLDPNGPKGLETSMIGVATEGKEYKQIFCTSLKNPDVNLFDSQGAAFAGASGSGTTGTATAAPGRASVSGNKTATSNAPLFSQKPGQKEKPKKKGFFGSLFSK